MFVLKTLDHLIHLLTKNSLMSLEITRESKIVWSSKWWNRCKSNLTCNLREPSYKMIEYIIDTFIFYSSIVFLLCLKKHCRHSLHKIIYKNSKTSCRWESPSRIVRLKNESHLFETHHIIANGCGWNLEIILRQKRLRPHNLSCFEIFFDNMLQDEYFSILYSLHKNEQLLNYFCTFLTENPAQWTQTISTCFHTSISSPSTR